jgi:hypothetical protein
MSLKPGQQQPDPVGCRHRDGSMSEPSPAVGSHAGPAGADPLAQVTKARAAWLETATTIIAEVLAGVAAKVDSRFTAPADAGHPVRR